MVCGQFVWSSCLDCQHVAQKKINLCCEGEWKVCVCLLNKSSTVEQHIFSIEAKANWFVEYYSLFQCAICKRALQTLQFNTAVAEVFLRWPVYNYSVVMRLNFNPPFFFFGTTFGFDWLIWYFSLSVQVKHYNPVGIKVQIWQNDCAISWVSRRNSYCTWVRSPLHWS